MHGEHDLLKQDIVHNLKGPILGVSKRLTNLLEDKELPPLEDTTVNRLLELFQLAHWPLEDQGLPSLVIPNATDNFKLYGGRFTAEEALDLIIDTYNRASERFNDADPVQRSRVIRDLAYWTGGLPQIRTKTPGIEKEIRKLHLFYKKIKDTYTIR